MEDIAQGRRTFTYPYSCITATHQNFGLPMESNHLTNMECIYIGDDGSIMAGRVSDSREHLSDILGRYFRGVTVDIENNRQWCSIGPVSTGFGKLPIPQYGNVEGFYHALLKHTDELRRLHGTVPEDWDGVIIMQYSAKCAIRQGKKSKRTGNVLFGNCHACGGIEAAQEASARLLNRYRYKILIGPGGHKSWKADKHFDKLTAKWTDKVREICPDLIFA